MRTAFILSCLAVVVFLAFWPALGNGFQSYDDAVYVTGNSRVASGLSWRNAAWAFTSGYASNWHPLTWLSHQLDSTLFGVRPPGHHLTSLLLHIANTLLLFVWLAGATGKRGRSFFVAAIFGVHPLRVESVAWVAERKDVLSTFFWMLALIAYTRYARRPAIERYLVVALCFAASLAAKPMLVTAPLLLLMLDWWPLGRMRDLSIHRRDAETAEETQRKTQERRLFRRWMAPRLPSRFEGPEGCSSQASLWRLVLEKVPLLALSALSAAVTVWAQRAGGSLAGMEALPLELRLANAVVSYVRYLGKTLWPVNLAVFYPYPLHGIPAWKVAASAAIVVALTGLAFAMRKGRPWLAAGWTWYLLTLLPVIGIVQVGMQAMADRYTYVPMVGLLMAIAWQAGERSRLAAVAAAMAVTACAMLTWQQAQVWKNGLTLFAHAAAVTGDNFVAHDNLGVEFDRLGRYDDALAQYRETLRIRPGDRHGEENYANATFSKAERLFHQGSLDEALRLFREGLSLRPDNPVAHMYAGLILTERNQILPAMSELRTALRTNPGLARAHMGLGVALARLGYVAPGRDELLESVRLDASSVEAYYDLGLVQAETGNAQGALQAFDAALLLDPSYEPARAARMAISPRARRR